jgi:hypothetical protein
MSLKGCGFLSLHKGREAEKTWSYTGKLMRAKSHKVILFPFYFINKDRALEQLTKEVGM